MESDNRDIYFSLLKNDICTMVDRNGEYLFTCYKCKDVYVQWWKKVQNIYLLVINVT